MNDKDGKIYFDHVIEQIAGLPGLSEATQEVFDCLEASSGGANVMKKERRLVTGMIIAALMSMDPSTRKSVQRCADHIKAAKSKVVDPLGFLDVLMEGAKTERPKQKPGPKAKSGVPVPPSAPVSDTHGSHLEAQTTAKNVESKLTGSAEPGPKSETTQTGQDAATMTAQIATGESNPKSGSRAHGAGEVQQSDAVAETTDALEATKDPNFTDATAWDAPEQTRREVVSADPKSTESPVSTGEPSSTQESTTDPKSASVVDYPLGAAKEHVVIAMGGGEPDPKSDGPGTTAESVENRESIHSSTVAHKPTSKKK
jgi:hypothetical protein